MIGSPLLITTFVLGMVGLLPRLFWTEVIEGQIGKQNFVVHMTESFREGFIQGGFPLRFFFEAWHSGPVAWAEEFPLYHLLTALFSWIFQLPVAQSGRWISFAFALLLLRSVYRIFKNGMPNQPRAAMLAVTFLSFTPGFRTYSTSVMPDMAAFSTFVFGLSLYLDQRKMLASLAFGVACLLKYYALFPLAGFSLWLIYQNPKNVRDLFAFGLAAIPSVLYVFYFIKKGIPNPVTEYRDSNGYGHLAGNILFELRFYQRFFTWTAIKIPSLIGSLFAIWGLFHLSKFKSPLSSLSLFLFGSLVVFALVFGSSFYVHDYYALPFLLPITTAAVMGLQDLFKRARFTVVKFFLIFSFVVLGVVMSDASLGRLTHYSVEAGILRRELQSIPDKDTEQYLVYVDDFSTSPLPVLSRKTGTSFSIRSILEDPKPFEQWVQNNRVQAVVLRGDFKALQGEWAQVQKKLEKLFPLQKQWESAASTLILYRKSMPKI